MDAAERQAGARRPRSAVPASDLEATPAPWGPAAGAAGRCHCGRRGRSGAPNADRPRAGPAAAAASGAGIGGGARWHPGTQPVGDGSLGSGGGGGGGRIGTRWRRRGGARGALCLALLLLALLSPPPLLPPAAAQQAPGPPPPAPSPAAPLPPPPAPKLPPVAVPEATAALADARRRAATPIGVTVGGLYGLSLEEQILMARLSGHEVRGSFDAVGSMSPADKAYWRALDDHLEATKALKHMYESTWYKCSKLSNGLPERYPSTADMEEAALPHVLAWLGLREEQLPRRGALASFDQLVELLDSVNASARLVSDPLPFLATQMVPTDRNGLPLLVHMTFKDKAAFARHHVLSLASWARANPDYALLMYDDADLEAYLTTYLKDAVTLYQALKTPVERSDLWRYVVMCNHGGIYADADTLCIRPVQEWNRENGHDAEVFFGVEDVFRRDPSGGGTGWGVAQGRFGIQFEQWVLASAPGHPVYCGVPQLISERVAAEAKSPLLRSAEDNWSILHRTGPHVWTDSVLRWTHAQGIGFHEGLQPGGRLIGTSARIMPGETFGCAAHFFSNETRLDEVYVMHMFRGVWRKRPGEGASGSSWAAAAKREVLGF